MHFLLRDGGGRLLLRHRPPQGLLGGMPEIPGTPWREGEAWSEAEALPHAPPLAAEWRLLPGVARHGFTHLELEMRLLSARLAASPPAPEGFFWLAEEEARRALPSAMGRLLALESLAAAITAPASAPIAAPLAGEAPAVAPRAVPARGRPRGAAGTGLPKRRTKS
ncbi:NUDIX domain-containing protein [Roseomonas mucosa]|nr:NUDIX domain-containing protein [Roseomonas mucosa]MCG7356455.1 NUDIX domain-containing protein [Roseomonas mucosa]